MFGFMLQSCTELQELEESGVAGEAARRGEVGRKSEIDVVVDIDNAGEILEIELSGEAVEGMEGSITIE